MIIACGSFVDDVQHGLVAEAKVVVSTYNMNTNSRDAGSVEELLSFGF